MSAPRVVVVGAGIGGLAAAIRLARGGARVTVLEQGERTGGKMGEHREAGFRWDTGPSVITMRPVLEELYAAAGTRLEDELDLVALEPITRYLWPDGSRLDLSRDLPWTLEQIRAIEPRDAEGYLRFLAHAERLHRTTGELFVYGAPPTWRAFFAITPAEALRLESWRTLHASISARVRSPQMRQLLGRFATYVGASPYRAPGTLGVIAHVELNQGVWYPRGGVYGIARSLTALAGRLGVEVRTGARVERVEVAAGRATGVVLAGGEALPADAVLANVDVASVAEGLLPGRAIPARRRRALRAVEPSFSGFALLLAVRGRHDLLAHHTILFAGDYRREFEDVVGRGVVAADPTVYLALTCRTDPADAPAGHENWFLLVNAPPLGPAWDWADRGRVDAYRDRLLERVAGFGVDARDAVVAERRITPADVAADTGAYRGALYGPSANRQLNAFLRPRNRDPHVRGLYYAGGTTHPGGGVPMVMLSGRYAASLVAADLGLRAPVPAEPAR